MVKESKHSLWGCLGALICPWSLHFMVPIFDTLDVVYVRGGRSALTLSDGPFVGDKRG